jgi:STE24 endopeptidase
MTMMAAHMQLLEINLLAFMNGSSLAMTLVIVLFLFWKLELIATLLNLKSFATEIPSALRDLWTQESYDKARAYSIASARFSIVESAFSLTLLLSFWMLGGFTWLDGLTRGWYPDAPIRCGLKFLGILFLGQYLVGLPLAIYDTFVIEEKFGFNKTTPKLYALDQIKSILLGVVIGVPMAAAVLWIFASVAHAWLWAWVCVSAFQLLMMWLAPAVILPLFNKFTPMPEGELRDAIEAMAKRCEFPIVGLFVMDGSKRSTKANAFFTGFGKTKKIALFDTLIDKHSTEELVAILAHEIGHFRCKHIPQRLVAGILQSALLFFLIGLATDPGGVFARLLFDAFGVATISPHVGLVLFGILFSPASRLLGILTNRWSRKHEFEADAYAAKHTGSPNALITALKKLSTDNLAHPTPHALRVALDYSHPPLSQRLAALEKKR